METTVKKHLRRGKNKKYVVKRHTRRMKTHRIFNGERQVFVDGFWKHDDYPNAPKPGWSYEHLIKERTKLQNDLIDAENSAEIQTLPLRKLGILTRRIRKINRILKRKSSNKQ